MRHAFIALGSNLGNRVEWIEIALQMLDCEEKVQILQTSSLWETKAMYVEDQPPFLNGACEIITTLHADHLMATLKRIENKLGREKTVDKGPRNIDLDLLLYGQEFIYRDQEMVLRDEKHLTHKDELFVPHLRMVEREFVLRPMCQYHLRKKLVNSTNGINPQSCLWKLPKKGNQMLPYTPLKRYGTSLTAQSRTHIMAILNLTPDSFSDGGQNLSSDPTSPEYLSSLRSTILSHITSGATIIDIGGQSTRPNAPMVSAEEELSRILPAISLIKSLPEAANTIISIDTFRAFVARAAISAGADLINDVSAGTLDPDMLPTVADLNCSICLMHMRGTPETMTTLTDYPDGVVQTVGDELLERVRAAEEAGIRRWRIILDPGIGFAKTAEQNIELLRGLSTLMTRPSLDSFPWLIGTSRKGFIGKITAAPEPKDRVMGTAVTATQAVNAHANIIRVHDVKPIVETVAMAEAL
ncbi:putative multifunctional folic acid synthesis protein, partial [Saccharata proteae CBS 121410]